MFWWSWWGKYIFFWWLNYKREDWENERIINVKWWRKVKWEFLNNGSVGFVIWSLLIILISSEFISGVGGSKDYWEIMRRIVRVDIIVVIVVVGDNFFRIVDSEYGDLDI